MAILLLGALAGAAAAHPHFGGGRMPDMRPPLPPMMAQPPHRMEQDYARQAMRAGEIRPLRDIAGEWRGAMPGYDFIGSEFDPESGNYRLKFMREGSVVWLDVDGRGREIRRSGH